MVEENLFCIAELAGEGFHFPVGVEVVGGAFDKSDGFVGAGRTFVDFLGSQVLVASGHAHDEERNAEMFYIAGGAVVGMIPVDTGSAILEETKISASKDAYLKNKADAAKERKRLNDLKKTEETIEKLENRLSEIDQEMALPENISNAEALTKLSEEAAEKNAELEQLYALWEELSI